MLQVARLAPAQLGEARDLVAGFLRGQVNADGGFRDRSGASDLYYTVFGLDALIALQEDPRPEPTAAYLQGFGDGSALDLVHVACLARAWAPARSGVPIRTVSPRTVTYTVRPLRPAAAVSKSARGSTRSIPVNC